MSSSLFLSRVRLRRDAPAAALRALLVPRDDAARVAAGHRIIWTLFADSADRARDFLWRESEGGVYYVLSARVPSDQHGLFEIDPPKAFAPALSSGDRLAFSLRANATVARGGGPGRRGKPCDVVMDTLRGIPPGERAGARRIAMETAGMTWLAAQAAKAGFAIVSPRQHAGLGQATEGCATAVTSYRTLRIERRGPPARIGVIDFEGVLEVRDPAALVAGIARGFGRAKAFGCGLMLVRRV